MTTPGGLRPRARRGKAPERVEMYSLLNGIRLVDISGSYSGPYCSMLLGDLGAEIIKVEKPDGGDDCRSWGPPFINGESAWFLSANRNKKSVILDISLEKDREVLLDLLKKADVFLENLNPRTLEHLELSYEKVKQVNEKIVFCAISGFGHGGPYAGKPGYDLIAQATSGLMSVTGEMNGHPQRVGTAISDITTGIFAAFSIVSALLARVRTGKGYYIDLSLLDTDLALMSPRIAAYLASGIEPKPSSGTDSVITIYQSLPTADRHITVATGNQKLWASFCRAIDREELQNDPRFYDNAARSENKEELLTIVEAEMVRHSAEWWLDRLSKEGVPCAPVLYLGETVKHPQVKARGMIQEIDHPQAGMVKIVRSPCRFVGEEQRQDCPPPELGRDTEEILGSILEFGDKGGDG